MNWPRSQVELGTREPCPSPTLPHHLHTIVSIEWEMSMQCFVDSWGDSKHQKSFFCFFCFFFFRSDQVRQIWGWRWGKVLGLLCWSRMVSPALVLVVSTDLKSSSSPGLVYVCHSPFVATHWKLSVSSQKHPVLALFNFSTEFPFSQLGRKDVSELSTFPSFF